MSERLQSVDVAIIGGGPAGMSAALWCRDLNLDCVLIEREPQLGGQLFLIKNPIRNYLGINASDGSQLFSIFLQSLKDLDLQLELDGGSITVDLERCVVNVPGKEYRALAVIWATGVRRRSLDLPDEGRLYGRGLMRSGIGEHDSATGKTVIIVGGGDAALENAVLLSRNAERVVVVHRRDRFTARPEFIEEVLDRPNIDVIFNAEVTAWLEENGVLAGATICDHVRRATSILQASLALVRIGVVPNTDGLRSQLELDDDGYIVVDRNGQTSLRNVFAIGDVAHPLAPTISTATGSAAMAVRAIYSNRISGNLKNFPAK